MALLHLHLLALLKPYGQLEAMAGVQQGAAQPLRSRISTLRIHTCTAVALTPTATSFMHHVHTCKLPHK